jgi:hypothetical protein
VTGETLATALVFAGVDAGAADLNGHPVKIKIEKV